MKKSQPFIAKVTRPALAKTYLRKRLFHLLDQSKDQPVIWISGPAGSGKTTLISSYIESKKIHSIWYRVDEADADLATFFYYMGIAGKKAAPRKKKPLPLLSPEYMMGIPTFAQRFFQDLFGRLPVPSVLILDNYHHVPDNAALNEILLQGFSMMPDGMKIIILSRSEIPKTFVRLRANGMITTVNWSDLRFTEKESNALISLRGGKNFSKKAFEEFYERTSGWAAGIMLLIQRKKATNITDDRIYESVSEEVFDYFAEEVFKGTDPKTQDLLLRTAFLPWTTARMADALTGDNDSERILNYLYRNNYFTDRLAGPEPRYQFHLLFREYLLAKAMTVFEASEVKTIQNSAAGILEESGEFEHAVELFGSAENWKELARIILNLAQTLLSQGRNLNLEEWIKKLPDDVQKANPWILYWLGICKIFHNPMEAREYFSDSFQMFKMQHDTIGTVLSWTGVVDTFMCRWSNFVDLDYWIKEIENILGSCKELPIEIEARAITGMIAALFLRKPTHPSIPLLEEKAHTVLLGPADIQLKMTLCIYLLHYYEWLGDCGKVIRTFKILSDLARQGDMNPFRRQHLLFAKAAVFWFLNQTSEGIQAVEEALDSSRKSGIHIFDIATLGQGVYTALISGNLEAGGRYLDRMAPLVTQDFPGEYSHYLHLRALESAWKGQFTEAYEYAMTAYHKTVEVGFVYPQALNCIAVAHALIELDEHEKAKEYISLARSLTEGSISAGMEHLCLMHEAYSAIKRGLDKEAMSYIQEMMELGRKSNIFNFSWWRGPVVSQICTYALEAGIEVKYVKDLIKRRNLVPEKPPLHVESWPWPLKIFTLGRFSVLKDESPLQFGGKAQRKPVEMLKVIIALGGREVREERISDILWPEADGAVAHSNFSTTLSRLRKFLGYHDAVQFKDGRITFDARLCWVDAWAFERMLSKAEEWRKGQQEEKNREQAEQALALYRGAFLSDDDESWTVSLRERLRRRFLKETMDLGLSWEKASTWQQAVECYQNGLRVDDLAEVFYQRLMVCYQKLGLKAEALSCYCQCRDALRHTFDAEPSEKTQAIYQDIRKWQ